MTANPDTSDAQRLLMEAVNRRQRDYYDATDGGSVSTMNSAATNLWRVLRRRAQGTISDEARALPYEKHRDWMGDLSGKRVLDLGCGTGTALTDHLVRHADTYHAIDLADAQVGALRARYGHLPNTAFIAGDFLAEDAVEGRYDVIYAHSVCHHFRYMAPLFDRIEAALAPGGVVITLDPAQVWWPARAFRALFRPFQTDAEWEFPFDRKAMDLIETRFRVADRMGIFGRAKWAWVLGMINPAWGKRHGDRWFREDFAAGQTTRDFRNSLVVSYLLQARDGAEAPA